MLLNLVTVWHQHWDVNDSGRRDGIDFAIQQATAAVGWGCCLGSGMRCWGIRRRWRRLAYSYPSSAALLTGTQHMIRREIARNSCVLYWGRLMGAIGKSCSHPKWSGSRPLCVTWHPSIPIATRSWYLLRTGAGALHRVSIQTASSFSSTLSKFSHWLL